MSSVAPLVTLARACVVLFVFVANASAQANIIGQWEPPFSNHSTFVVGQTSFGLPDAIGTDLTNQPPQALRKVFNAIHMSLIPFGPNAGRVVVWDDNPIAPTSGPVPQFWSIVDPGDLLAPTPISPWFQNDVLIITGGGVNFMGQIVSGDLFCAGHAWDEYGYLLVAGGTSVYPQPDGTDYHGAKLCYSFDPSKIGNAAWTRLPDLDRSRFYPTVLIMGDGRDVVLGGTDDEATNNPSRTSYEALLCTPTGNQTNPLTSSWDLDAASNRSFTVTGSGPLANYPRMFVLATGQMFRAGYSAFSRRITHVPGANPQIVSQSGWQSAFGTRTYGGAVLMPISQVAPQDVVFVAGGQSSLADPANPGYQQVPRETEFCSLPSITGATGTWTLGPLMKWKRRGHNMVILPDGGILAVGGRENPSGTGGNPTQPLVAVQEPEILAGGNWTAVAWHEGPREYHSTALLLPDGRVLVGGGNTRTWDYQIYHPPYLFRGTRPKIWNVPTSVTYGKQYAIGCELDTTRLTMIRVGSVTHHCDCNQRMFEFEITGRTGTSAEITMPANRNIVPPGYYMLFGVTQNGVPSIAEFVHVF